MVRVWRIGILTVICCALPFAGFAGAVIVTQSDEGALDYGLVQAFDYGPPFFDPVRVSVDGGDWREFRTVGFTEFIAESGPLLSLNLTRDASGAVVESRYEYDGGTFYMDFGLKDPITGETAFGQFTAPILGLMTVVVRESNLPLGDSAEISYQLGPGLFDKSIARMLAVARHTGGGAVYDPWLTFGTGDYTSLSRRLDEGAATVEIDVPEPASLLLWGAAGMGMAARRRRKFLSE
jgi:hypothetical protein